MFGPSNSSFYWCKASDRAIREFRGPTSSRTRFSNQSPVDQTSPLKHLLGADWVLHIVAIKIREQFVRQMAV